ncbi:MAG: hypothetical protein GZ089_10495 [Aromatoleum sp.]|nr:hypothetical protein [Aromatoleum sp.]
MSSNPFGWPDWRPGDPPPPGAFPSRADELAFQRALNSETAGQRAPLAAALRGDLQMFAAVRTERSRFVNDLDRLANIVRIAWASDAFFALVLYRLRTSLRSHHIPFAPTILHRICMMTSQVCIGDPVVIAPGVYIPHGQIVIDGAVRIGTHTILNPWVTIGLLEGNMQGPTLGDGVFVGTGAKILGPVQIGANAKIAANSVVLHDVAPDTTVAGAPARLVADRREPADGD